MKYPISRGATIRILIYIELSLLSIWIWTPKVSGCGGTKEGAAQRQIESFSSALDAFLNDCGRYPETAEGLEALMINPGAANWKGPYWFPADPWGNRFEYQRHGSGYELRSIGPDRISGTEDDIANLNPGESWQ